MSTDTADLLDAGMEHIPAQSRGQAELIPHSLRQYIREIGHIFTPETIARLTPDMADWDGDRAWRALFRSTAFDPIRMEQIVGSICAVTCEQHPRYPYYPYVPMKALADGVTTAPLVVSVHGSCRSAQLARDRFVDFAERNGCFVLAPLFPMDLRDAAPDEQYKYVYTEKVRFDLVVWDLIEDFSRNVGVKFGPIILHGYSGGGQFVNRFIYLHADKIAGASMGAPGYVTLPDENVPFWTGIGGLGERTGIEPNLDAIARIPLHLLIGEKDDHPIDVYSLEELGLSEEGYARYGHTRMQRAITLRDAFRAIGADVTFDVVPGMKHEDNNVEPACRFFECVIAAHTIALTSESM